MVFHRPKDFLKDPPNPAVFLAMDPVIVAAFRQNGANLHRTSRTRSRITPPSPPLGERAGVRWFPSLNCDLDDREILICVGQLYSDAKSRQNSLSKHYLSCASTKTSRPSSSTTARRAGKVALFHDMFMETLLAHPSPCARNSISTGRSGSSIRALAGGIHHVLQPVRFLHQQPDEPLLLRLEQRLDFLHHFGRANAGNEAEATPKTNSNSDIVTD